MTYILELNDSALSLSQGQRLISQSPGYAHLSESGLILGHPAQTQAYLSPLKTTNQFWHQLSQNTLPTPIGTSQTAADFAHAQLLDIWSEAGPGDSELIFAIPGNFSQAQASLLLGIAEACPFQTQALVDTATAASCYIQTAPTGRLFHLNIQLHATVLTEMVLKDQNWSRNQVHEIPTGILKLENQLAHLIRDYFLQKTRFDPFHEAATEQALYDSLPKHLDEITRQGKAEIQLFCEQQAHQIILPADKIQSCLMTAAQPLTEVLNKLVEKEDLLLIAENFSCWLPILSAWQKRTSTNMHVLPDEAVRAGILSRLDIITNHGNGVPWVTYLPMQYHQSVAPAPEPTPEQTVKPTHLLIEDRAFPIGRQLYLLYSPLSGFTISTTSKPQAVGQIQLIEGEACLLVQADTALQLNRLKPDAQTTLVAGDHLTLAHHSVHCISVTT